MKHKVFVLTMILLFFQFISCNDELVVDQNEKIKDSENPTLSKEGDLLNSQKDSISLKEKKERILKLKKDLEIPYVVIEKPEKLLVEKLSLRKPNKSFSKTLTNPYLNSVQGILSCYTLEIEIWALDNYVSKSNYIVGILPKGSYHYPDNLYWQYDQNILSILKNKYAFNKICLERAAIASNSVYQPSQILAGGDGVYPSALISSYSSYSGNPLWGLYTDEPYHRSLSVSSWKDSLNLTRSWWKWKMGASSIFIGGETCLDYTHEYDHIVDFVNMTAYRDMITNFLVTCVENPLDADQRSEWSEFNSSFNSKFNHLWISGASDQGEMNQLIGHAQNMNKNSIWLYAGELGISDQTYWNAIYEFCYYSFMHSFINRKERKYIFVYNYIGFEDPCYDYQITSWELVDIVDTGITRILAY
jgi:hypothetical protein